MCECGFFRVYATQEGKMADRDTVWCGVLIGEHGFDRDAFIEEIEERIVSRGLDFAIINTTRVPDDEMPTREQFVAWARYFKEKRLRFVFVRMAQNAPVGHMTRLDEETVAAIREAAGEYFLGDCIAEPGHAYAAKEAGYYRPKNGRITNPNYTPRTDAKDMREAHGIYTDVVRGFVERNRAVGIPSSVSIEATALSKYNIEAGIGMHILEIPNGDPDIMMPSIRGAVRNLCESDFWGTLIAHEWYGGMRNSDVQKRKRLDVLAKYAYINGAGMITLESGDNRVVSYGQEHDYDSEVCRDYRKMLSDISAYIRSDSRPAGGPRATFGILSGIDDGWTGFCQSSLWNQFGKEEFGHSDAEASWRLLSDFGTKRKWSDIDNYGDEDLSAYPAWGTYDIVPAEADVDAMSKYEYLVFLGWNTMNDELMDKLTEYAKRGGKLLLSGAHLNYNPVRGGEFMPPPEEKLMALCGCRYTGELFRTNYGTKICRESLERAHLYPVSRTMFSDPIYSAGYTSYMVTELCGAEALGYLAGAFSNYDTGKTSVIEHRLGEGLVTLVTSIDYPGNNALTPLYGAILREHMTASARECELKVIASDKLRYTVYSGDKIYLLNTDSDLPITVRIIFKGEERLVTLDSLELRSMQL